VCYNCGCHIKQDDMGSPDNITEESFEKAAKAWGQPLLEAKKNTYLLLREELKKTVKEDEKDREALGLD
jgi:malate synthase